MTLNEQNPSDNVNPELEVPIMEDAMFDPGEKRLKVGTLPIWAMGAMVVLVAALVIVFMYRGAWDTDTEWRQQVESKLRLMEDRLVKLEETSEGPSVSTENGQVKAFEHLDQRMNALEQNFTTRLSTVENRLKAVADKITAARASAPTAGPAASSTRQQADKGGPRFHVVKSGETYYSISRMFGMSVDELLKKNNMKKTDIIKPGQKLAVGKTP